MRGKEHWDKYFEQHKYPCMITNKNTNEVLYYNCEFERLLGITEDRVGEHFFDLVNKKEIVIEDMYPDWDEVDTHETESYNKRLHRKFLLKSSKMDDGETIFCEMVPIDNTLYDNVVFEKAVASCSDLLTGPEEGLLPGLMKIMAEFYKAERAYVYTFDLERNKIRCISQWSEDPNFRVTQEVGEVLDSRNFITWLKEKSNLGIISASNRIHTEPEMEEHKLLKIFKLKNMTLCNVEDGNNEIVGLIGVSNIMDEEAYFDRRLMHTVARFVAQEVAKEKMLADQADSHYKDAMTGAYSRNGYAKMLDTILSKNPSSMGVISVNINGLRHINEFHGIAEGDKHIKKCADRLKEHFGYTLFRMSGDEFLAIAPDVSEAEFEVAAMKLYIDMRSEGNYDFSFGHAWSGKNPDVMKLNQDADMIMYINKQQYYAEGKKEVDPFKDMVLAELLDHLKHEEFMIYLQPQVWLKDGELYGAEALIRMKDRKTGQMVFPDQFIPKYEEKAVIRHLDMFVLEAVCKLQKELVAKGKRVPISVNFSRITLQEYGIVDSIVEICQKYQVPHELVVIEVTERVGLINNNVASVLVQQFKDNGFYLSLDDFGCAYSNIITLAQVEVDEVKIDKSLVDYILSNNKNKVLVKSILTMCNELEDTATLAEGIEIEEQGRLLHELGCKLGQGYYYSRPIPVDGFMKEYIN